MTKLLSLFELFVKHPNKVFYSPKIHALCMRARCRAGAVDASNIPVAVKEYSVDKDTNAVPRYLAEVVTGREQRDDQTRFMGAYPRSPF